MKTSQVVHALVAFGVTMGSVAAGSTSVSDSFAPTITRIGPETVYGDVSPQPLVIEGINFAPGAEIVLRDVGRYKEYRWRPAVWRQRNRIVMLPNFGNRNAVWSVEVINPDRQSSGATVFRVHHSTVEQRTAVEHEVSALLPADLRDRVLLEAHALAGAKPAQGFWPDDSEPDVVESAMPPVGGRSAPLMVAQAEHTSLLPNSATAADAPSPSASLAPPAPATQPSDPSSSDTGPGGPGSVHYWPSPQESAVAGMGALAQRSMAGAAPAQPSAARPLTARPAPIHAAWRPAPSAAPVSAAVDGTRGYQPGVAAGPESFVANGEANRLETALDQYVQPERATGLTVSNRAVNRIACSDSIDDVVWSEERPVKVSKADGSVYVKFLVQRIGDEYRNIADPVDVHIVCGGAMYTMVLKPVAMDPVTVHLVPGIGKTMRKLAREYAGLPVEQKVQRLTLLAFKDETPEGFERRPIAEDDPRRHITLYAAGPDGARVPVSGIRVTGLVDVLGAGTGLKVTEYQIISDRARELREGDFLSPVLGDLVSVTVDPLRVEAGQPARLIVVSRSVGNAS